LRVAARQAEKEEKKEEKQGASKAGRGPSREGGEFRRREGAHFLPGIAVAGRVAAAMPGA